MPSDRHPHAFPRAFRLKQERLIRALFDRSCPDSHSLAVGAVRLVYRPVPRDQVRAGVPVQVGFAPGRRVANAVERNRVRRQLREVYRRHQGPLVDLFEHRGDTLTMMILFRGAPEHVVRDVPRHLPAALDQLADRLGG